MEIYKNISLKPFNTFGIESYAGCLIKIKSEKDARSLFSGEIYYNKPIMIIGGGSNILLTRNIKGTVMIPRFRGIRIEKIFGDDIIVSAGAGVVWDKFVEWSVEREIYGLENLSNIPGSVGAVPIQNIGAYGVEIKDLIEKVRTVSIIDGSIRIFSPAECRFGYRDSIFKHELKNKYLVTRVYFRLMKKPSLKLNYGSVKAELEKTGDFSLKSVRNTIINIRNAKLPDPKIIGNAGSFFKNPVVSKAIAGKLKSFYPSLPVYDDRSGGLKIAAGWLIEQCGWKGKRLGNAGIHDNQALVIVNHEGASGQEIYELSEMIKKSVKDKFNVVLEREVEVI